MFEKKKIIELDAMALRPDVSAYYTYCDYIEAANAEIDRLNSELTALRAQSADERVWISSETHPTFPESGFYYGVYCGDEVGSVFNKSVENQPQPGFDYTLILAKADFPVPPKPQPLEVKVGKYELPDGRSVEITTIDTKGRCLFVLPLGDVTAYTNETALRFLESSNARFIGEGDNQ